MLIKYYGGAFLGVALAVAALALVAVRVTPTTGLLWSLVGLAGISTLKLRSEQKIAC